MILTWRKLLTIYNSAIFQHFYSCTIWAHETGASASRRRAEVPERFEKYGLWAQISDSGVGPKFASPNEVFVNLSHKGHYLCEAFSGKEYICVDL